MKGRRKRTASILCFFKPRTKDDLEKDTSVDGEASPENRRRRRSFGRLFSRSKSLTSKSTEGVVKQPKESSRRILSKIMSSISSDSSNWGGKRSKLLSRSLKQKESGNESFMKASQDYNKTFSVSSGSSYCSSYLSIPSSSALYSPAIKRTALPLSEEWNYRYTTVVCFLLLSFCVLVFCGRMCAILWTATWLSFIPQRRKLKIADVSEAAAMWRRAEKDKRLVMMEGFLERNREFTS